MTTKSAKDDGEHVQPMYCSECDGKVPENWDAATEQWKCPVCGSSPIYEDKGAYIKVLHGTARFQKERGYGPWYEGDGSDKDGESDS